MIRGFTPRDGLGEAHFISSQCKPHHTNAWTVSGRVGWVPVEWFLSSAEKKLLGEDFEYEKTPQRPTATPKRLQKQTQVNVGMQSSLVVPGPIVKCLDKQNIVCCFGYGRVPPKSACI